jgi:hypothetical protein
MQNIIVIYLYIWEKKKMIIYIINIFELFVKNLTINIKNRIIIYLSTF